MNNCFEVNNIHPAINKSSNPRAIHPILIMLRIRDIDQDASAR
jgi:hypothetical protein